MPGWFDEAVAELTRAADDAESAARAAAETARGDEAADVAGRLQQAAAELLRLIAGMADLPPEAIGRPAGHADLWSKLRHDLRNPPNQLIGYSELLEEEVPELDAGPVRDAARAVNRLIDRLLPKPRPAVKKSSAVPSADPATAGRILVVDDQELSRDALARLLTPRGHSVTLAADGEECLGRLTGGEFDLILLDVMMPGISGEEVLRRLKADPKWRHVPVIMVSAADELDRVVRCIEAGAEDYLPKPAERVLLEARIGACLEKKRLRDRERDHLQLIERQKERYNHLLHTMLPAPVVRELSDTGEVKARRYENVAVLFADIVGFTSFSRDHSPEEVVSRLQALVREFEAVCDRERVLKIKTIGDSFMAAAGLLEPVENPVRACVRCGVGMLEAAGRLPPHWRLRIGVHVGSVVAGLLGNRHDLFDLWGDAVNTAARVEQNGSPGAVTLSDDAWERVEGEAEGVTLGKVDLKGRGEVELTVFVRFRDAR